MSALPSIAVIDDGELDDIRNALEELGMEFVHWRRHTVPSEGREPSRLLVTTASAAVSLGYRRAAEKHASRPVWVAVTDAQSRTQRSFLLQGGFDYLVSRPVHPTALRLLLQRALYQGDDFRRGERVAVGYSVTYRVGLLPRKATLIDLSPGGCRLLTRHRLKPGTAVMVRFPKGMDRGKPFSVRASVLRTRRAEIEGGDCREVSVALRFRSLDWRAKARLRALLGLLASGPASLPERLATGGVIGSSDAEQPARMPRAAYDRQVMVFGDAECVLVGRDLSRGGMRVDPHPALTVGVTVRLAISGGSREEPVVVDARVARDEGEQGVALIFNPVEGDEGKRLEAIVAKHPEIESLPPGPSTSPGVFLSSLVPSLLRVSRRFGG